MKKLKNAKINYFLTRAKIVRPLLTVLMVMGLNIHRQVSQKIFSLIKKQLEVKIIVLGIMEAE